MKKLEVILDTNPSGGCGCNCGCGGSSVVEDMNELVEEIKSYEFDEELNIDVLPISQFDSVALINKINSLLENTNANFRVDSSNLDDTLSNILPLIVLDNEILTAYGVPTIYDVVNEVSKNI